MEEHKDFFEKLHPYLKCHPKVMASIPFCLGVFCILSAIFDWDLFLKPSGTFRGLGGLTAMFGRGIARIACAIVGILFLIVAWVMFSFDKW